MRLLLRIAAWLIVSWLMLSVLVVLPFRWVNPPLTMVMFERWLSTDNQAFRLYQDWLSWEELPKHAALAVVAAEDQRFPLHRGFDVEAIQHALREREQRGQLRGASTISQQVAKNMYLWTGRSWFRKALEAWFTVLIEFFWGKQRILEVYLNIAEWGEGVFGLEAASQYHFGRPAVQLSPMQAALLASSLPSPLTFTPANPGPRLQRRAEWNLQQQRRLGGEQWLTPLTQAR